MPENLDWLNGKVPIWAVFLSVMSTGAIGLTGGSSVWNHNNEQRFVVLQDQINDLKSEVARKVDTSLRLEMKREIEQRIDVNAQKLDIVQAERLRAMDAAQRHFDYIDRKLDALQDRLGQYRQSPGGPP